MSTEQTENNNSTPQLQPGTVLRAKRESLGWSQQEIADRLRLRIAVIENIEHNDFKSDQVATFTRGYLRSYAKVVGLNEDDVLSLLDGSGNGEHKEQTMQSFSRKTKREKHNSRVMLATWGIMITLVGISSVWWWQNQEQDTLSVAEITAQAPLEAVNDEQSLLEQELAPEEMTETEVTATEAMPAEEKPEVAPEPAAAEPKQPQASEPVTAKADAPTEAAATQPPSQKQAPQPVVNAHQLEMEFKADCWIQVKDATGKTLATGVKKAGRTLSLNGQAPYNIILGAPEGVSMTYASEPVDLSGYKAGKVAKFKLP